MQNYNEDTKFDMVKIECKKDYGALKWEEGQPNFYLFEEVGVSLLLFPR